MQSRRVLADLVAGLAGIAVGAVVTALVHASRTRPLVQRVDDRWYRLVQRTHAAPREAAARTLDVAFGTTVDWTVRLATTAQLLRTRRWSALAGWAATVALGEISVGPLKSAVDRPRPGGVMTRTSMASYPSGHALAAATTAPGIVIALLPPGRKRRRLLAVAVPLAGATALSRTFLNAHWLSDVVGGFALGTGYALAAPAVVDLVAAHALGQRNQMELFEQVVNLVRRHALRRRDRIQQHPGRTFDAAARWVDIPASLRQLPARRDRRRSGPGRSSGVSRRRVR